LADELTLYLYTITFRIKSLNFTQALTNHSSPEYLALYNITSLLVSHYNVYRSILNYSVLTVTLLVVTVFGPEYLILSAQHAY